MHFGMILLIVYLSISVAYFCLNCAFAVSAKAAFRRKHPNEKWINPMTRAERFISWVRSLCFIFFPIFHLFMFICGLFAYDKVVENLVEKIENTWIKIVASS